MRIVIYAHHTMFEPALSLAHALSACDEVHLMLQTPSTGWEAANFRASERLPPGVQPADGLLEAAFPSETRRMWNRLASFQLVVTGPERSRHPRSLRLMQRVLRQIRSLRPDVLHVDDVDQAQRLALAMAVLPPPCPLVVGCHDPEPHSGENGWPVRRRTRSILFRRATACLVHHEYGVVALRRRHPRLRLPVHAVRLGTYEFLQHGQPRHHGPGDRTVLLFGRMTAYKGLETLYQSLPLLAARVGSCRIVVAGAPTSGYQPPATPTVPANVVVETHFGYADTAAVARLFGEASVVVCPYTDASQSGVVLTAYAFGIPVVATAVGGLPEYVIDGRTGLLVPPGDCQALAAALARCLEDAELLATLRLGVVAAAQNEFTWARSAERIRRVYAATCREGAGRR